MARFYGVPSGEGGLWKNGGNLNNWIAFKAQGAGNNTLGLNARFTVYAGGKRMTREVQGGGEGGSTQGMIWPHFGIGTATTVDSVIVLWADGVRQKFTGLGINKYWTVVEGATIPAAPPRS